MDLDLIIKQETIKQEILELLKPLKRKGIKKLVESLEDIGYFKAPASTQYHLNYEGGLAEHSLNVCKTALNIAESLNAYDFAGVTNESIIIASLLHDIAKGNFNGEPEYKPNILKSGALSDKKPYIRSKDRPKVEHSILGTLLISKYIDLTNDELVAIMYHDGQYLPHFRTFVGGETPLWLIIHFADMWNSKFIEGSEGVADE